MAILSDYITPLGAAANQGSVRVLSGRIALVAGAATEALPAAFAGVPADWPVMSARNNAGTAEGHVSTDFDPAGPEINFTSDAPTDDAAIMWRIEVPTSFLT